ncbi:MAG: hypothetical protein HC906_04530, partial [Bacteroidales bacterium]|nr:hypothetical protein [Bacteroidales bacterium]
MKDVFTGRGLPGVVGKRIMVNLFKTIIILILLLFTGKNYAQDIVTVFSETFDNATTTQPWAPNYSMGFWKTASLATVSGKGKALRFDYKKGEKGSQHGCGNYKIYLDSAYKELYLSWEYYIPSDFDYGFADGYGGGKFFGGFSGGQVTKIPNNDKTDNDGWMSMFMFQNGYYATYNYFKNTVYSSLGWPNGQKVANLVKGQWRRITIRAKMNDGDQANGYFE